MFFLKKCIKIKAQIRSIHAAMYKIDGRLFMTHPCRITKKANTFDNMPSLTIS